MLNNLTNNSTFIYLFTLVILCILVVYIGVFFIKNNNYIIPACIGAMSGILVSNWSGIMSIYKSSQ
jgi:hypothetical protein